MNIKEMRKQRGLSGYMVAEAIKVSPQYYYEVERGEKNLTHDLKVKLSQLYGISIIAKKNS